MDVLDHLTDRQACGRCGRLIPFSDDFCSSCRRPAPAPIKHHILVVRDHRTVDLSCTCGWGLVLPAISGRRTPTQREAFDMHVIAAAG